MTTPAKKITRRTKKATIEAGLSRAIINLDLVWQRLEMADGRAFDGARWDAAAEAINRVQKAARRAIDAIPEDAQ